MRTKTIEVSSLVLLVISVGDLTKGLATAPGQLTSWLNWRAIFLAVAGIFIFVEKRRPVKRRPKRRKRRVAQTYAGPTLASMLAAGFFGGFLGGVIAGLPFGTYYYLHAYPKPHTFSEALLAVFENVVFTVTIGIVIGALTQLSSYWVRKYWGSAKVGWQVFVASLLAGAIGGALLGYIGGVQFGMRPLEAPSMTWVVGCATFGTCSIAFGALLYEYELDWARALKALTVVVGIFVVAAIAGKQVLHSAHVDLGKATAAGMALSGAEIGLITGAIMGAQIAGTQILYRVLNVSSDKNA